MIRASIFVQAVSQQENKIVLQPALQNRATRGLRSITEKIHHKNHITWIRKGDNMHSSLCFLQSSVNSSQCGSLDI